MDSCWLMLQSFEVILHYNIETKRLIFLRATFFSAFICLHEVVLLFMMAITRYHPFSFPSLSWNWEPLEFGV